MHDWQHNVIFAPVGLFLLWGTHLAWAIEAWRRTHGAAVEAWLESVGEFEALSSLSAYAYEHPADPYPTVAATGTERERPTARFDATELGHPLLPAAQMVRNDVRLEPPTSVMVVSGSNMSGKSRCCGGWVWAWCWLGGGGGAGPGARFSRLASAPRCGCRIRSRRVARASSRR